MIQKINKWWHAESDTFTHLMNEGNESFSHGDVVLTHLGVCLMVAIMLIVGSL